jgi:hypothetical protein
LDAGRELRQALPAAAADADEERVAAGEGEDPRDLRDVLDAQVEV